MDGGSIQSPQVFSVTGESMTESAEDPGSSNGNGDKRCGRQNFWRPVRKAYSSQEVRI